jgi:hypothetical protein
VLMLSVLRERLLWARMSSARKAERPLVYPSGKAEPSWVSVKQLVHRCVRDEKEKEKPSENVVQRVCDFLAGLDDSVQDDWLKFLSNTRSDSNKSHLNAAGISLRRTGSAGLEREISIRVDAVDDSFAPPPLPDEGTKPKQPKHNVALLHAVDIEFRSDSRSSSAVLLLQVL